MRTLPILLALAAIAAATAISSPSLFLSGEDLPNHPPRMRPPQHVAADLPKISIPELRGRPILHADGIAGGRYRAIAIDDG